MSSDSKDETSDDPQSDFLFGLLAINEGLIDGPTLADALATCQERKGVTVGEVLIEIGAISTERSEVILSLMEQYLKDSGGDIGSLLSGVLTRRAPSQPIPELSEESIKTIVDNGDDASLQDFDTIQSHAFGKAPQSGSAGVSDRSPIPASDRFKFVKELKRGGLGVVSVAVDGELRREVALKRIRPEKAFDTVYRDKFLREAEITGNLEHPGVVPVYGMGTDSLGHLFYAMRLIRGATFTEMIQRHWADNAPGPMAFHHPRLITLIDHFMAACQTIHYAHERGVLHRDLKPDNVMVGSYGETLVVDWGLAKIANDTDKEEAGSNEWQGPPEITETPTSTRFGAAMGTPAYASPELITGQILDIDHRSDVFGLGAILFEVLSGQAPLQGRTMAELKKRAASAQICNLSELAPFVPKPLAAVCNKCLEARPEDRYQSVGELIEDLQCWKADQPVTATPDSKLESIGRWFRHHRSIARSGVAALAAAIFVAVLAGYVLNNQKQQYRILARENGELAKNEALLRERAQSVRDLLLSTFRSPDPRFDGHSVRASELLDRTAGQLDSVLAKDDATRGQMYLAIGKSYLGMGQPNEAVLLLRKASDIYRTAYGERASETLDASDILASALLNAGSFQESKRLLEQTLRDRQDAAGASSSVQVNSLQTMYLLGENHRQTGNFDEADAVFQSVIDVADPESQWVQKSLEGKARILLASGEYTEAQQMMESVYESYSSQYSPTHPDALKARTSLAEVMQRHGDATKAVKIYRAIMAAQVEALGNDHIETITTKNNLAFGLKQIGDLDASKQLFSETYRQFVARLGPSHPHSLVAANNYAEILESTQNPVEAVALLSDTVEQFSAQFPSEHPDLVVAKHNLGSALFASGQLDKAKQVFLEILETLEDNQNQALARANAQIVLGAVLSELGEMKDALEMFAQATEVLSDRLGESHPETLKGRVQMATAMLNTGDVEQAVQTFELVVPSLAKQLGPQHPETLSSINQQATGLMLAGRNEQAVELLTKTMRDCEEKLGAANRYALTVGMNRSVALCRFGNEIEGIPSLEKVASRMRKHLGKTDPVTLEALGYLAAEYFRVRWYDQALDIAKQSFEANLQQFGDRHPHATRALLLLGRIRSEVGQYDLAAKDYQGALKEQASRLGEKNLATIDTRLKLSHSLLKASQVEEAISALGMFEDNLWIGELSKAGDSAVDMLVVSGFEQLSQAYHIAGKSEESIRALKAAVDFCRGRIGVAQRKTLELQCQLGIQLSGAGEHQDAIKVLSLYEERINREVTPIDERFGAMVSLGRSYLSNNQADESLRVLRVCEEISASHYAGQWRQAWALFWLAQALESAGEGSQAKESLTRAQAILDDRHEDLPSDLKDLPKRTAMLIESLDDETTSNE